MTAYIVVRIGRVIDKERYEEYRRSTPALLATYGASYVVRGASESLQEGDGAQRFTIIQFPSMETIERFWTSVEYAELRRLRAGAVELTIGFVPGVDEPSR